MRGFWEEFAGLSLKLRLEYAGVAGEIKAVREAGAAGGIGAPASPV
jgi:hypothetical protein